MSDLKELHKKIILLGDGAVGKTSLIRKFVLDKFDDDYITTVGSKVTAKEEHLNIDGEMVYLKLQIWDILGQKGYTKLHSTTFIGTDGVFLVADITRKDTLKSIENYWLPEVHKLVGEIPMIILANKSDLKDDAQFSENYLKDFATSHNAAFYLTSAKNGENVKKAFRVLGKRMYRARAVAPPTIPESDMVPEEGGTMEALIDRIIDDFCREYGNIEDAMPVLRKQFELAGVSINEPTREALIKAVKGLAGIEGDFKKKEIVETNLNRRLKWIRETHKR